MLDQLKYQISVSDLAKLISGRIIEIKKVQIDIKNQTMFSAENILKELDYDTFENEMSKLFSKVRQLESKIDSYEDDLFFIKATLEVSPSRLIELNLQEHKRFVVGDNTLFAGC